MRKLLIEFVPGLIGGAVGAALGYLAVAYLLRNSGFWVPILPGAFAGIACGQLSAVGSKRRGVANGLIGLAAAIFAQWRLFSPPFEFDGSLPAYCRHLLELPPLTLGLMVLNGLLAFWWGREERIRRDKPRPLGEV